MKKQMTLLTMAGILLFAPSIVTGVESTVTPVNNTGAPVYTNDYGVHKDKATEIKPVPKPVDTETKGDMDVNVHTH